MSSPYSTGMMSNDPEDYLDPNSQFKYQPPPVPQTGLSPAMQWIMPAVLAAATAYRPHTLGPAAQTFGQVFDTIQAQKARQAQLGMENQWRDIGQQARLAHYGATQAIEQKGVQAIQDKNKLAQQQADQANTGLQSASDAYLAYVQQKTGQPPTDADIKVAGAIKGNQMTFKDAIGNVHPEWMPQPTPKTQASHIVPGTSDQYYVGVDENGNPKATPLHVGVKPAAGDGGEKAPNLGALKGQKDVILGKIRQLGIDDPTDPRATDGLTEIELEKFNNLSSKLDDVNEKLAAAGVPVKAPTKPGAGAGVIPGVNSPAGKALASKYGL